MWVLQTLTHPPPPNCEIRSLAMGPRHSSESTFWNLALCLRGWRLPSRQKPAALCPREGAHSGSSWRRALLGRNERQRSLLLINIIYYLFKNSFLHFVHVGWQNKCRQVTNPGDGRNMGRGSQRESRGTRSWPSPLPRRAVPRSPPPPPGLF